MTVQSTTFETIRRAIGSRMHMYVLCSTTTNITTNDKIIDSKLEGIGYHTDDDLNNWWVWLNTTANAAVERMVEDHTGATGQLTIRGANLSTETASAVFELHMIKPSDIKDAVNYAISTEYNYIFQEDEDVTITTQPNQLIYPIPSGIQDVKQVWLEGELGYDFDENILQDYGGFETWDVSTRPNGSDAATGLTLTQVDEDDYMPVKYGSYACKCVAAGSTSCSHYWTEVTTPANYGGRKTTYSEWVYSEVASRVSLTIVDDQGSTSGTAHAGGGWERLTVTHNTTASPTSLKAGILCSSGDAMTFYRDNAIWTRSPDQTNDRWIPLYNCLPAHNDQIKLYKPVTSYRALKLVGVNSLSTVDADTDTVEIGDPQLNILINAAIVYLYRNLSQSQQGKAGDIYAWKAAEWERELNRARHNYRMISPHMWGKRAIY